MSNGFLALEDGTVFPARSVGAPGVAFGEAVFTTAMTGYQETVTDPSYAGQLVCFTAPMVGNYGVAGERSESARTHARAVLMREARGPEWTDWLREQELEIESGPEEYTYSPGYYAVFFADPDGLKLELVHIPGHAA